MEKNNHSVICLREPAFYALIDKVVEHIKLVHPEAKEPLYLDRHETMKFLNVGLTKLQELRDTGAIRFTQPSKKHILYERLSLVEYLRQYTKHTF